MRKNALKLFSCILIVILLMSIMPVTALAATANSSAGVVSVSYGALNVRESASTSSSIITSLPKGSYVTLLSKSGSWWNVEYAKGQYGYCSAAYIMQVSGAYGASPAGSLNVRSGPGTSYGVIGWLNSGEYAVVLSSSTDTWKKILFNGTKVGYVNGKYLQTAASYSAVSLNVPSYKQTDSRWAYTTIGSTGKTIGAIGCATTALAMTESYRTGTTIYPNAMASQLSYTSGGAVYWPSNYTAYTGSDYLTKVYQQLKSGKPVLVGLRTSAGSQHWCVVTGYVGGTSLNAASFTVNDPGSSLRTTLQQVIGAYPYFYKLMYY